MNNQFSMQLRPIQDRILTLVPTNRVPAARNRALRLLDMGQVEHPNLGQIKVDETMRWDFINGRTNQRFFHGFLFLADWHTTILVDRDNAVGACAQMLKNWSLHHVVPTTTSGTISIEFHDETTAQRVLHLGRFLIEHWSEISETDQTPLRTMLTEHTELLGSDWFYAGCNNHGMFQDFALLVAALAAEITESLSVIRTQEYALKAVKRLGLYFQESFGEDGVHTENSPGYHLMAARSLRDALPVIEHLEPRLAESLTSIYHCAEEYAVHSILPNGRLAPLSDTKQFKVWSSNHSDTFRGNQYRSSMTGGRYGIKPTGRVGVFPYGGYAIYRSRCSDAQATWILFKAGYRANYHHHCDDLSILFYRDGDLVLSEAGPYGYEYRDPLTRYAFSQWAHNNIVVDGISLPRVDSEPGGIEFQDLTERQHTQGPILRVRGINRRSPDWTHQRTVTVAENWSSRPQGVVTTVSDHVTFANDDKHVVECLWHGGPGITINISDNGTANFSRNGMPVVTLAWASPVPLTARVITGVSGDSQRSVRFPTFGKVEPGTVLVLTGEATTFEMTTTIT